MMEYAIQILNIELYKWQEVYNKARREMNIEPNEYSNSAMKESDKVIKELTSAIYKLKQ